MLDSRCDLEPADLDHVAGGIHIPQLPRDDFRYQDRPLPENFGSIEQDRWYGDFTRERGDRRDGDPERAARDNMWREPDRYEENPNEQNPDAVQPLAEDARFGGEEGELGNGGGEAFNGGEAFGEDAVVADAGDIGGGDFGGDV